MNDVGYPKPHSTVGERLLIGVRNLWMRVKELQNSQEVANKIVDHQGKEIEQIKRDVHALRSEIRGLKISRGKALAKNARLLQQITEAESGLSEIERQIH
jgi:hypothetical protein